VSYESIIIGGGPSGLIAAQRIAKDGHRVLVLEEHPEIGVPDHCAGLISSSGLRRLKLVPPDSIVQNTVIGARVYSPSGHSLTIERGKREAYVINRQEFDKWLAKRAEKSGAVIRTKSSVRDVTFRNGQYIVQFETLGYSKVESSKTVINAEGSRGKIAKTLGLGFIPKRSKLPAYQYEVSGIDIDADHVEMFYGRQISNGFFAWIIPLGDGRARIGVASRDNAKKRLKNAICRNHLISKKLEGMKVERGFGGVVLVGMPLSKNTRLGAISLGDAAGMVKATTGGGIVTGGTIAELAGEYISKALRTQNGMIDLHGFENKWKASLYKEFQSMYLAQRVLTSFSDKGIDALVEGANRDNLLEIIRQEGDMDMQQKVILTLLRNPKMLLLGMKAIRYFSPFM